MQRGRSGRRSEHREAEGGNAAQAKREFEQGEYAPISGRSIQQGVEVYMMLKSKARRTSRRVEKVVLGVALYVLSGEATAGQGGRTAVSIARALDDCGNIETTETTANDYEIDMDYFSTGV